MDRLLLKEKDFDVDLESGVTSSEEDLTKDSALGSKRQGKTIPKVCGRLIDGSVKAVNGVNLCGNIWHSNGDGVPVENLMLLTDEEGKQIVNSAEKKLAKEKRKKTSNKKAPKPPLAPKGPSLDAADQKLIREISELVMLKRARNERMKALKKMKAAKPSPSSSGSNLFAMVFTVFFCLVIIFQGMSSRTSLPVSLTPAPAVGMDSDLISVQYYRNPSTNDPNGMASESPNLVEQVAGLDTR